MVKSKKWPIITNFSLPHSLSLELYIISSRFLVHRCKIMISSGAFPYFSLCFLLAHLNSFFDSCFSSSSINAKQKFWSVPHLLHIRVIFVLWPSFLRNKRKGHVVYRCSSTQSCLKWFCSSKQHRWF